MGSAGHKVSAPRALGSRAVGPVALALLGAAVVQSAWLCDDAAITFRVADNLLRGYGPRWNVAERVQAYTHPLWLALLSLVGVVTREQCVTALAVSIALSCVAAWRVLRARDDGPANEALRVLALFASSAFVDYATSGLENPLSNVLLVALAAFARRDDARRDPRALGLLAALLSLTRLDLALFASPLALDALWRGRGKALRGLALGVTPLLAWTVFSVVYYGVPLPNTAYAKLGLAVAPGERLAWGVAYLLDACRRDPATPIALVAGLACAAARGARGERLVAVGAVAYVAYVVRIGGDFMAGRFLVAPLVVAVTSLSTRPRAAFALSACLVASMVARPPTAARALFDAESLRRGQVVAHDAITDERAYYAPYTGLSGVGGLTGWRQHPWALAGDAARASGMRVVVASNIGFLGLRAGPGVLVVDRLGLADALMARMPASPKWRPGHPLRRVPEGYVETLRTGVDALASPAVAAVWEELARIHRGPLWRVDRWRAIARVNTGRAPSLDAAGWRDARDAPPWRWSASDPSDAVFVERGVRVALAPRAVRALRLRVGAGTYTAQARSGGELVGEATGEGALRVAVRAGRIVDAVWLSARGAPWRYEVTSLADE